MSFGEKSTTSFSVSDILSPIEESYKKQQQQQQLASSADPNISPLLSPYRAASGYPQASSGSAMNSLSGMNGSNAMAYYNMAAQLSHPSYASGYCNPTEGWDPMASRNASAWYGANASECSTLPTFTRFNVKSSHFRVGVRSAHCMQVL